MIDVAAVGFILAGLVLLLAGAALSVYGVAILGVVVGGSVGYLTAPTVSGWVGFEGVVGVLVAVVVGATIGVILAYMALSFAVAFASVVIGILIGKTAIVPLLVEGPWFIEWALAIGIGLAVGLVALILTKSVLILLTSTVGGLLVTRQITLADLNAAGSELTLEVFAIDVTAPLFLGIVILGILVQFGLFKLGYVARIRRFLPGYRLVTDRRERA